MTPGMPGILVDHAEPQAWLAILPVVVMLAGGAVLTMFRRRLDLHAPLAIAALVVLVLLDGLLLARVMSSGPLTMVMGRWLPPFGIAFTVDIAGAMLALASALIALAASVYSLAEIDGNHRRYGFFPFLLFLMAGVSGAFLTGDIFNLYVWFEVLLISSFGLLVLGGEREQIDGATKYGLLNLVGTTLFLIATGYLYALFGTLNMADIATRAAQSGETLPLMTLATLYLTAFGMKAAAFPLNSWLPASYHTPRIVVSALFAGILTKLGIYAMFRVLLMLLPGEGEALRPLIALVAILTMMVGALGAIGVSDIRRMLGYWVIAGIGVILSGLAIGGAQPVGAALFYALHSMAVMSGLYFLAGVAGRAAGSFDLARLGGLYRLSPLLTALAFILLFSVSGLPPLSGFWPKALLVRSALETGHGWLAAALLASGFLITFAAGRIVLLAFWRPAPSALPGPLPSLPVAVVGALAALTLLIGIWPEPVAAISRRAAEGLVDPATYIRSVFPEPKP